MADENTSVSSQASQENPSKPENKMSQNAIILGVVVVIALVVGVVSFMAYKNSSNSHVMTNDSMTNESTSPLGATDGATQNSSEEQAVSNGDSVSVSVEGGSFYFKPNTIKAKVGQKVKVTLNAVSMQHNFVIDALNVKSATIPSGKSTTVEFVPTKAGSFEFYCSIGNHKQMGMVGTLIVEN